MNILYCLLQSFVMRRLLPLLLLSGYSTWAQHPVVSSVSSVIPRPGNTIIVTGSGYDATLSNNLVYIGGAKASVSSSSVTSLDVVMPNGASHGALTVINLANGLSGSSSRPLLPTYNNTGYDATVINLQPKVDFTAGANFVGVATGDLDGDGKSDIVVVDSVNDNIQILQNTATSGIINAASFAVPFSMSVQTAPCGVSLGDIDGDGKLDIVVSNSLSNSISIFRNISSSGSLSAASFAARVDITGTNAGPRGICLTDWDMDGKADIAVACQNANIINVFRSNCTPGNITTALFDPKENFTPGTVPIAVLGTDIDGDAKPDMCVLNNGSNNVTVLRNTATSGDISVSSFAAAVVFSTATAPASLAIADIDGDGQSDLIASNSTSNTFSVLRNTSSAGVVNFATKVDFIAGAGPSGIAVGDINGDSKADIIVGNRSDNNVGVYRNTSTTGTITTTSFSTTSTAATATAPVGIAVADADNDGMPDIISVSVTGVISVLRNNPIAEITGTFNLCVGNTSTLSNATAGGVWASSHTAVATINTAGLVTAVSPGTAIISYTVSSITTTKVVTVNPLPNAGTISGAASVCVGATTTLSSSVSGGSWTSSTASVATVGATGVLTGVAGGAATITYAVANGCGTANVTRIVTVNPLADPGTITGVASACVSASSALSSSQSGGVWSSGTPAVCTISSSGVVDGLVAGTSVISYSATNGCGTQVATIIFTVNALPDAGTISGTATVCTGSTTALSTTGSGGIWSSSNNVTGTISASGIVAGISAGTTNISYIVSTVSCGTVSATTVVTVNSSPVAGTISGSLVVCEGSNTTLTSSQPGGTWAVTTPAVATIDPSTGLVTAISAGTTSVSYTVTTACGSDVATVVITINALPAPITGILDVCVGSTTALSSATTGGTWSSGNTSIATINSSGLVSGVSTGVVLIEYTQAGCSVTVPVTVNLVPFAGTLSGATTFCAGTTTTITSTASGGTWSSASPGVATVDAATGVVSGVTSGTSTISYTLINSCGTSTATAVVTVLVTPVAGTISGPVSVCASGSTITLTGSSTSGVWFSSNTVAATVSATGVVTGADAGTTTISYSVTNICGTDVATTIVTVNPLPDVISGPASVCTGATITLTSATAGGSWASAHTTASVDAAGMVTGIAPGTARISYTLVVGCFRTVVLTVNASPAPIGGLRTVCEGANTVLTQSITGGTWSSSNPTVATIPPTSGIVSAISAGTTTITYTRPITGCISTAIVTVNPLPAPITGDTVLCMGATGLLSSSTAGGAWVSGNTVRATVGIGTGVVNAVTAGTVNITYTTALGCRRNIQLTINQSPQGIAGSLAICQGSTSTLTNIVPFGVWISSNTAVGVISGSGVIAGVAAGTSAVTYMLGNGCYRSVVVTVNPLPTSLSGPSAMCVGSSSSFTATPAGGTWVSSNLTRASIVSFSGNATALSAGTVAFSYILPTGCRVHQLVTINPVPVGISGTASACVGSTTLLSSAPVTGTWSSSNSAVATVASVAGVVTGVSAGTAIVTYMLPATGCFRTVTATINPLPSAIVGTSTVCVGATTSLSVTPAGGSWSSSNPSVANIGFSSGLVNGLSSGTTTVTYATTAGCIGSTVLTVNALASAGVIFGTPTFCEGSSVTFSSTSAGGTWNTSTGNVSIVASGLATGISAGTDTVLYTVSNSCNSSVARYLVTVNPLPETAILGGQDTFCLGRNGIVSSSVVGGVWSSGNTSVITIAGGIATPVTLGTAIISYSTTNTCGTSVATVNVEVVNPIEAGVISGPDTVCYYNTITLSSTVSGGEWSSSSPFVSVDALSGVVTGLAPGIAVIRHVVSNQCSSDTALYSIYVKYSIDCPTQIQDAASLPQVSIYPIPTNGSFFLRSTLSGFVSICGIDGREMAHHVVRSGVNNYQMPDNASPGVYIARFTSVDGATVIMRFVYEPR